MGNSNNNHSHSHSHDHAHQDHNHDHSTNQNHSTQNPQKKLMKDSIMLPHFAGQVAVDKVNKVFIKKIQIFQFEYQYVQNVIKNRMRLKHPNFITVKNYSFQPLSDNEAFDSRTDIQKSLYFCYPQSKILRLQFDPAILNVNGLIKSYCQKRQPMEEQEIRTIIKAVVDCLIFLKMNGEVHGDIKPSTIFINPRTKVTQLIDSFLVNNGRTAYEIVNENSKSESFLAPEQLEKKKQKKSDSLKKIYQSEVFCLGLTMIEMMTFEASMEAYNLQDLEIKRQFLERKMVEMRQYGYSYELADLSLRCIHKNPSKRPTFQEIQHILCLGNLNYGV